MIKLCIRVAALAAILAWPAVLSYQVWEAQQQLAVATEIEKKVSLRLADARAKADAHMAQREGR